MRMRKSISIKSTSNYTDDYNKLAEMANKYCKEIKVILSKNIPINVKMNFVNLFNFFENLSRQASTETITASDLDVNEFYTKELFKFAEKTWPKITEQFQLMQNNISSYLPQKKFK